jgi:hypothetical protein
VPGAGSPSPLSPAKFGVAAISIKGTHDHA